MTSTPRALALSLALLASSAAGLGEVKAATPVVARQTISEQDLRRHVSFLASDTLEGRAAGTQGGQAAASYLAAEFRKLKLAPAGETGDYYQEFGRGYRNVLALIPGSDPVFSKQIILLGGHFDHVGYGKPSNSFGPFGQIHNGADDNASGTAAILEVAEAFAQLDQRPARSVLFALWDAEEAGMLGSEHWATHAEETLPDVKLAVNIDMIGRLRNDRVTVYGARTAAGLRRLAALCNQESRLELEFDWTQREDSDHWTFFRRKIPYLMLHTGEHEDYHRPSDDVHKLNYDGLERLSQMMFEIVLSAASAADAPAFRSESAREGSSQQRHLERARPVEPPARLGIAWAGREDLSEPFVVTRVVPDSPAAAAGLRSGDRIVRFAELPASQIDDLASVVLSSPEQVQIEIERDGEPGTRALSVALRGNAIRLGIHWRTDETEPEIAIVTGIVPGSPAARAGFRQNDRLYSCAGATDSASKWLANLSDLPGGPVEVQIERDGRLQALVVELLPPGLPPAATVAD